MLGCPNKSKGHLGGIFSDISTKKCSPQPKNEQFASVCLIQTSSQPPRFSRQALQCPITKELMVDPVVAQDGYTYDRPSIEQHWTNQLQGEPTVQPLRKGTIFATLNYLGHFQKDDK